MTRWGGGELSAESVGKIGFLGVAWQRDAKPGPSGPLDQTRPGILEREAVWSIRGAGIGDSRRKSRVNRFDRIFGILIVVRTCLYFVQLLHFIEKLKTT